MLIERSINFVFSATNIAGVWYILLASQSFSTGQIEWMNPANDIGGSYNAASVKSSRYHA